MARKKRNKAHAKRKRSPGKSIFRFLNLGRKGRKKTEKPKTPEKPKLAGLSRPKTARQPLIQPQHIENFKKLLHNLYFTKREEEIIERERENVLSIREISKELSSFEKNTEKKLADSSEMIRILEESLSATNAALAEMRKDNEELRKERKFLADKLDSLIAERVGADETTEMSEPGIEEEKGRQGRAFAGHGGERKIKTSLDQILELVMEKGSIKIPDAAKKLRVKDKQVEEWARILEEHDLIEIHYPTFGKPFLKKKA